MMMQNPNYTIFQNSINQLILIGEGIFRKLSSSFLDISDHNKVNTKSNEINYNDECSNNMTCA